MPSNKRLPNGRCNLCGGPTDVPGAPANFCSAQCLSFYQEESGDHRSFCVGLYECDQAYGGREEGGWYYTVGTLKKTVDIFRSLADALHYTRRLNQKLKSRLIGPNAGRRDMYSAASEGEFFAYCYGTTCPKTFPETKPRYE